MIPKSAGNHTIGFNLNRAQDLATKQSSDTDRSVFNTAFLEDVKL